MSDILDDLKMMADHLDRENADEPCDLGLLLIRAIAEIRKQRGEQPVCEVPMPELETMDNDLPALPDLVEMDDARWGYRADDMRDYGEDCWEAGYAAGVAAIGWRDVADELPKEAQEVLFVRGGKTLHGAWIGGIFRHSNQKMVAAKWMPLPAPQIDAALRGEVKL